MTSAKQIEFEKMGGTAMLVKINTVFYDKIYADPWIQKYFSAIPQEHIERQQVAFMQAALGGENLYCGQTPPTAHKHMYITEELFKARQVLLEEAFKECNANATLVEKWLRIDEAFYKRLVKASLEDCEKRYKTDVILDFPKPFV